MRGQNYGFFGTGSVLPSYGAHGSRPGSLNPNQTGFMSRAASQQSEIPYYLQRPEDASQTGAALEALSAFADGAVPQARVGGRFRGPVQVHDGETVVPNEDGSTTVLTREESNRLKREALQARHQRGFAAEDRANPIPMSPGQAAAALQGGDFDRLEGRGHELSNRAIGMEKYQGENMVNAINRRNRDMRRRNQLEADARLHTPTDEFGGMTPDEFIKSRAGTGKPPTQKDIDDLKNKRAEQRERIALRRGEIIGKPGEEATISDVLSHKAQQRRAEMRERIEAKQQRNTERREAKAMGMSYREYRDRKRQYEMQDRAMGLEEQRIQSGIQNDQARTSIAQQRADLERARLQHDQATDLSAEQRMEIERLRAGVVSTGDPNNPEISVRSFDEITGTENSPVAASANGYMQAVTRLHTPEAMDRAMYKTVQDIQRLPANQRAEAALAMSHQIAIAFSDGQVSSERQKESIAKFAGILEQIINGENPSASVEGLAEDAGDTRRVEQAQSARRVARRVMPTIAQTAGTAGFDVAKRTAAITTLKLIDGLLGR